MLWWLVGGALAAGGGFYHPNDVAAESAVYARSSEKLSAPVEALQAEVDALGPALLQYREALDLLGARAPAAERDRLLALEAQYNRQYAGAQSFLDGLVGGFDDAFVQAKDRAVAGLGVPAVECEREVATGMSMPGMPQRRTPNPACTGDDLNGKIAAAMDADPKLAAALEELLARPFPHVELDVDPQPVIGAGDRWISVSSFVRLAARKQLTAIDNQDDEARAEIDALLETGATPQELAAAQEKGQEIAAATAAKRAALAAPALAAADKLLAKWAKKEPATAWCANPPALGGCVGEDATNDLASRLVDEKKVAAAFQR